MSHVKYLRMTGRTQPEGCFVEGSNYLYKRTYKHSGGVRCVKNGRFQTLFVHTSLFGQKHHFRGNRPTTAAATPTGKNSPETEMEDSLSKLSASAADGPNDAAAGVGLGLSCRISHSAASEYLQLFKVSSFKAQLVDRSAVASSTTSLLFQTFITLSG